jgi:hypothetical protein
MKIRVFLDEFLWIGGLGTGTDAFTAPLLVSTFLAAGMIKSVLNLERLRVSNSGLINAFRWETDFHARVHCKL